MTELNLEHAMRVTGAALAATRTHDWLVSVAVIDCHGNLIHFARQGGSMLASVVSSQSKAWTAAAVGASTYELQAASQPSAGDRLTVRPCRDARSRIPDRAAAHQPRHPPVRQGGD